MHVMHRGECSVPAFPLPTLFATEISLSIPPILSASPPPCAPSPSAADVASFITPFSALDVEAGMRATSVYLVQRVIPMLPSLLCEELCR